MCGIVGVYYFDQSHPIDRELLARQTSTLNHRGPDGGGLWFDRGIGLGHRRLSIIDLQTGDQPMFDITGRYVVVFNGEIYNYRELREQLISLGHRFVSDSDTEVLLACHAEWGAEATDRLNGMFAYAIYDRRTHHLTLARDRLGKKPLYLYRDRERLIFASELKAIIRDPMVPRDVDPTAIADYFALGFVPAPKTIYRPIRKVPAAHRVKVRDRRVTTEPYWDVDYREPDHSTSPERHAEELLSRLDDAVKLRMRSDVPLGAFLSGGLDSSAVVGLMARSSEAPVLTNAVGFDVSEFDERKYAAQVAARFGTKHHEQVLSPEAGTIINQLSYFYDEPFGDSSSVPTYYLCEKTRDLVTVALSGDGGDELFAGYDHYPVARWTHGIRARLPPLLRRAAAIPLRHLFQVTRYHRPTFKKNLALFRSVLDPDRNAYNHVLSQPFRYREVLSREFVSALADYDPYESIAHYYARSGTEDLVSRMQYLDTKSYLCDDILVKVDRASMAHGLEVRCPLLDHRVVEYAARIPGPLKLEGSRSKIVLKRAIQSLIPSEFFDREKQGFAIPAGHWFRTALREPAEELFIREARGRSRLLARTGLRRMWREHQSGACDHGAALWNVTLFELWFRRFVERDAPDVEPTRAMSNAKPLRVIEAPGPAPTE